MNPLTLSPQHSKNSHCVEIKRNTRRDKSLSCRKWLDSVCLKRVQIQAFQHGGRDVKLLRAPECSAHTDPVHFCRFYRKYTRVMLITLICIKYHHQMEMTHESWLTNHDSRITIHIHEPWWVCSSAMTLTKLKMEFNFSKKFFNQQKQFRKKFFFKFWTILESN